MWVTIRFLGGVLVCFSFPPVQPVCQNQANVLRMLFLPQRPVAFNIAWLPTLSRWSSSPWQTFLSLPPILPSPQYSFYHPASQTSSPAPDRHSATSFSESPFPSLCLFLPLLDFGKATEILMIQEGQVWQYTSPRQHPLPAPRLSSWTSYYTKQPSFPAWFVDTLRLEMRIIILVF